MSLRVRPEVAGDILEAAQWYEEREVGLGAKFVAEVDAVFHRIAQGPDRFRPFETKARVALCHCCPDAISFVSEGADVVIVALPH